MLLIGAILINLISRIFIFADKKNKALDGVLGCELLKNYIRIEED